MNDLRFALVGAGFWARYQLAAWSEVRGARCVAIYNRTREKAAALAEEFKVPAIYDDPRRLFEEQRLDFADIVTDVATHAQFVRLAAEHRVPAICQKPLARSLDEAKEMAAACRAAGVPLLVHENWRWQAPLRAVKGALDTGAIGPIFRARIRYANSFPVFDNQPALKELEQFILTDIGTHILDTARFLFGEAESVSCRTSRIHRDIRGEDAATVMLGLVEGESVASGATVVCEMNYAGQAEHDRFPETFVLVEGERGTIELAPDYWLRVTTAAGTTARRIPPPRYAWADPAYDLAHASIVPCHRNLLAALRGEGRAETTVEDNLRTLELVFGAYDSAAAGETVRLRTRPVFPDREAEAS